MSETNGLHGPAAGDDSFRSEELLPQVYDALRRLAADRLKREAAGQTLQPTALVHEVWLRLSKSDDRTWRDRNHFFAAAAQAMRRILVERARSKHRVKRGGGEWERVNLEDVDLPSSAVEDRVLLVDQALQQLERSSPESARLITLKFFGGLTNREIAGMTGLTERSIERHWAYARALLYKQIQSEI